MSLSIIRDTGVKGEPLCTLKEYLDEYKHEYRDAVLVLSDIRTQMQESIVKEIRGSKPLIRFEAQEPTRYMWNPIGTAEWTSDIIKEYGQYNTVITSDNNSYLWRLAKYPSSPNYQYWSFLPSGFEFFQDCKDKDLHEREFDLSYSGRLGTIANERTAGYFSYVFEAVKKYKAAVIAFDNYNGLTNFRGLSNHAKLNVIGNSKISLVHNSVYTINADINRLHRLLISWHTKGLKGHPSFKSFCDNPSDVQRLLSCKDQLESYNFGILYPQHRYRILEAAFSRTLILALDDNSYTDLLFTRHEEYIPFTKSNIWDIVDDILSNPRRYQAVADNAYNRAIRDYSLNAFKNLLSDCIASIVI